MHAHRRVLDDEDPLATFTRPELADLSTHLATGIDAGKLDGVLFAIAVAFREAYVALERPDVLNRRAEQIDALARARAAASRMLEDAVELDALVERPEWPLGINRSAFRLVLRSLTMRLAALVQHATPELRGAGETHRGAPTKAWRDLLMVSVAAAYPPGTLLVARGLADTNATHLEQTIARLLAWLGQSFGGGDARDSLRRALVTALGRRIDPIRTL